MVINIVCVFCFSSEMRSREERSQFFDTNIGPGSALLAEESDLFVNDSSYDKVK